jgi:hypothetical protein
VSLLLNLQIVTKGGEFNNLVIMLMNLVHIFLGLSNGDWHSSWFVLVRMV